MMFPKRSYVRSTKITEACRAIPCQHCGLDDGTVVAAHSNMSAHGKGRSIKASDDRVASLCHSCHSDLDQGQSLSRAEREAMWWDAHVKTVLLLVRRALWPSNVPVPDISTQPF
jgi:hypothetical protein